MVTGLYHLLVDFFFFQAEDGIRDSSVTGVQTCALPICYSGQHDQGAAGRLPRLHRYGRHAAQMVSPIPGIASAATADAMTKGTLRNRTARLAGGYRHGRPNDLCRLRSALLVSAPRVCRQLSAAR